jgi:hypothetical protein
LSKVGQASQAKKLKAKFETKTGQKLSKAGGKKTKKPPKVKQKRGQ